MTNYELMYILDSTIDDAAKESFTENVQKIITDASGNVDNVDEWGIRKLAYPIQKKNEGFYVVINFSAEKELPKELDRRLRIADACVRHIIINKDDE